MSVLRFLRPVGAALLASGLYAAAIAANTDIATAPLTADSGINVRPNLTFILDDSGSMDWDYMPDWANDNLCRGAGATSTNSGTFTTGCAGRVPYRSADFNSIYYNPAIRYRPPVKADGTFYPEQNAANTTSWTSVKNDAYNVQDTGSLNLVTGYPDDEYCTDNTYTNCLRNGNYVLPGTVGGVAYNTRRVTTASGTGSIAVGAPDNPTVIANRAFGPYYYAVTPGEWCNSPTLRVCQSTQSATFNYPAPIRWCNSDANARAANPPANACQASYISGIPAPGVNFNFVRYPTKFFTPFTPAVPPVPATGAKTSFTIAASGCNAGNPAIFSAINVLATNIILSPTTAASGNNNNNAGSAIAAAIAAAINASSGTTGYSATVNTRTVTITAPTSAGNLTASAALVRGNSNACTVTPNTTPAFGGYVAAQPGVTGNPASFPGAWTRTDIVPTAAPFPRPAARSDCIVTSTSCSYAEEMTNFANWYTYYRTRMQMMKTSAGLAFQPVSDRFRIGYTSINNNTGSDFLNTLQYTGTQKTNWFGKLYAARPNNATPLRGALSTVGSYYAGRLTGSYRGSTAVDPMEYSCQKNYALLSTDGYWNETATPTGIDGATIGDQDGALARPFKDGNGSSNTLADVAAYFYATDIRTPALGNCTGTGGGDVCTNNVPPSGVDAAATQHMTTFTLGLGASGFMQFRPDYLTATSGDYFDVANGTLANPAAGICPWQSTGACTWSIPVNNSQPNIDDLWHAAVNGRGSYFSATNPDNLYTGISNALATIQAQQGGGAAATTSNPNVSAGDNFVFSSTYTTGEWTGDLVRRTIDVNSGVLSTSPDWSAKAKLDANTARKIFTYDPSNGTRLKLFTWANLTAAEKAYFQTAHVTATGRALSQFCSLGPFCLSPADQTAAAGQPLVDFIRGDRSNEGDQAQVAKYFRRRAALLGDIVTSEAVYVKKPQYNYSDGGYAAYKTAQANRPGMVYVGANDGMLHAFSADTGDEVWAYIPSHVIPNLYKLADKDYANRYQSFVDGMPIASDVRIAGVWHTVVIGGLGNGGRGYYALDVTDPNNPRALWEFTSNTLAGAGYTMNANLGLSFGRAEITKLKSGTWVALIPSGYNNVSPGDGRGYLFVVDIASGTIMRAIQAPAGSTTTPSGLAQIRAWVDSTEVDNTTQRVYGGDNLGNVWRFDVNGDIGAAGYDAQLLATLQGPSGNAQPVTARPELGLVGTYPVVYVGTGRYLGVSDLTDASRQSIYAIKDPLDTTNWGNPRNATSPKFVQQTLTDRICGANEPICQQGQNVRSGSGNVVNLASDAGWFVDLPGTRERANTDPQLALGTLTFTTNVLDPSACTAEGSSFINFFDYKTGQAVSTANGVVSVQLSTNALATRPVLVRLGGSGKVVSLTGTSAGGTVVSTVPIPPPSGNTRRVSWRELTAN
jgi:type IV pilus assembly protein PilY1